MKPVRILLTLVLAFSLTVFLLLFIGPHMETQPSIRNFEAVTRSVPAGTVPLNPRLMLSSIPDTMANPVVPSERNLARGMVYYQYYCLFCHGERGDGEGPVGISYDPKPADLAADSVQSRSDGALYKAMLSGIGHEPVLERVVPPEHRWFLVLYIRGLSEP